MKPSSNYTAPKSTLEKLLLNLTRSIATGWPGLRSGILLLASFLTAQAAAPSLLTNGGFENGLTGWSAFWSRESNAGKARLDTQVRHGGHASLQVQHRGKRDWCVNASQRVPVREGDIFEWDGWAKIQGTGNASLAVILYGAGNKVLDWAYGAAAARPHRTWQHLQQRFVIPPGAVAMLPRWLGSQPGTAWLDDVSLRQTGNLSELRRADLPAQLTLSNALLSLTFSTRDAVFSVTDRRNGQTWRQRTVKAGFVVREAQVQNGLRIELLRLADGQELNVRCQLEAQVPEVTLEIAGEGKLAGPLQYPPPFVTGPGTYLVVPMNEGISYPVTDKSVNPMRLIAYGGHGICMAFWGVTDGQRGQMAILETPDDAAIRIDRTDDRLFIAPEWDAQKGAFGYPRRLRYVFFTQGGHVAMAKRYRAYAKQIGRFKTLAQKRAENPNVDLLVGAVNVWCWDRDAVGLVKEMQAAGIQRILWSNRRPPDQLRALNKLGVLTSRYDIYQDAMNPANFPHLRGRHPDWTSDGWPQDLMIGANGEWTRGWRVQGQDGQWYPCGVLCDQRAPAYAAKRIPAELQTHPYRCRFIDTTTASPWRECYAPNHPMTRSDSREWKMKLLHYISHDAQLVTGSETGHDAAVPFVHYFEGMLSLGPYRVPNAGRDMARIWDEVPERVAKFQLGQRYRLPLWELVYHDCVVAQWYWGDYNNKLPSLWDKRDLFNALYGTPPMFMFRRPYWREHKARFVQSYRTIAPIARATGYCGMIDHRFLTPDRDVQQTVFANGVRVTVNFGAKPFGLNAAVVIPPHGLEVEGLK